jgi:prevent-host-death family protein
MTAVSIYEAKAQFSRLAADAEQGIETVVTRHGRPIARIAPLAARPVRRLGALEGKVWMADDFDEMTEDELRDWYGE